MAEAYKEVYADVEEAKQQLLDNGRQVFMVNTVEETLAANYALMWHYNPKIREWFNLTEHRLCTERENNFINEPTV